MNEAEYVVPPSNGAPNVSGSAPKPPKQPNKVLAWVKSNVATTVAGSVMAIIVILFGVAVVTNQKLEFAGINLNPLYQQASCGPEGCIAETFTIEGQFADGTVNVPYTQNFTVNPQTFTSEGEPIAQMCSWKVDSVSPQPGFETSFVQLEGGPQTTGTFKATPTQPGTYSVTIRVECSTTGQTTTKTLPWVVKGPSTDLTIEGMFLDVNKVAQQAVGNLHTVNSGGGVCTFELISSTPQLPYFTYITGPYLPDNEPKNETHGRIIIVPQNPGQHKVKIGVTCNPAVGDGPSKTAEKEFTFMVEDHTGLPVGNSGLDATGDFPDGTVNQEYLGGVNSVGAGFNSEYFCIASLKSISPALPGAGIMNVYNANNGELSAHFKAIPKTQGNYTVTAHLICADTRPGNEPQVPTIVFDKQFNWKVNAAGTTGVPTINLTGNFDQATTGSPYTSPVTVSVTGTSDKYNCSMNLVSVNPAITGAALVVSGGSTSNTAVYNFKATPQAVGEYSVVISGQCTIESGDPLKTLLVNKTFTLKVASASQSGALDISASFTDGLVNQAFSTEVKTVNGGGALYLCTLSLKSVYPAISGATLNPSAILGLVGNEAQSTFVATPTTAGTYTVAISAVCNPRDSQSRIPSLTKEKEFTWTVRANQIDPVPSGELSISANFANGKVGQAYTASVSTVNGSSTCNLGLVSVSPSIAGAMIDQTATVGGNPSASAVAAFKATPTTAGNYSVKISATCPPLVGDGPTRYVEKTFTWTVEAATTGGGGSGGGSGSGGGGTTANVCSTYSNKLVPIYRWWNNTVKDHFYTVNANEKPAGYISEGISGYVFSEKVPGSTAIYRSNNAPLTAHYYSTTDDAEKYGYKTEGILGYAFTSATNGTSAWYRVHKGWPWNDYLATLSTSEKAAAISQLGYTDAGTIAYICGSKS